MGLSAVSVTRQISTAMKNSQWITAKSEVRLHQDGGLELNSSL